MKLGTRNAGIRLDRAKWGMPARLTVYGDRDPCAGPGNIPWRRYWACDLRPILLIGRIRDPWGRTIGLHMVYGWPMRWSRYSRVIYFPWTRRTPQP